MKIKYLFEIYKDTKGEYRWRAKRNGRIVAESGEGYKRKGTMKKTLGHMIAAIKVDDFHVNEI
jgi:uncharacterized protein YegP (UPF0339 family)